MIELSAYTWRTEGHTDGVFSEESEPISMLLHAKALPL